MKSLKTMSLHKPDGNLAHTDKENTEVLKPHLFKVYNNRKEVNSEVLNNIPGNEPNHEVGEVPTFAEFELDPEGLTNDKAPGENVVSPNLIKALDTDIQMIIYNKIVEFWRDEIDFKSWHRILLK